MLEKTKPKKVVRKRGRPERITKDIVQKIAMYLRDGCTIEFACSQVCISKATFYKKYNEDKEFSNEIDKAKDYTLIEARKLVNKAITQWEDIFTARRYIEHKDPDFKKQTSIVAKTTTEENGWEKDKSLTIEIVWI